VSTAKVLDECVPSTDHSRRTEPFQTTHRPQSDCEPSMIGLDGVMSVPLHDVACPRQRLAEHPRVGGSPVGGHFAGVWTVIEGAGEEPAGGDQPGSARTTWSAPASNLGSTGLTTRRQSGRTTPAGGHASRPLSSGAADHRGG
jgi:hypothetical protein